MRIFHLGNEEDEKYFLMGRFAGLIGRIRCGWWEWSSWYNSDIHHRLLGHYLLFQHFKKDHDFIKRDMPVEQAYIYHSRSMQVLKRLLMQITSICWTIVTFGHALPHIEIDCMNRILTNERADVLEQFLIDAEFDFRKAILTATGKINAPGFICRTGKGVVPTVQVQVNNEINHDVHNHQNNSYSFNEPKNYFYTKVINMHPVAKEAEGARGKEKGVFSKKQMLIIFDLLSEATRTEKIDLTKPNKFDAIAALLHAMTGKSNESWMEELKDYKTVGLYEAYTLGELNELINTITNISTLLREAGLRAGSKIMDKKIRELERRKKTWNQ